MWPKTVIFLVSILFLAEAGRIRKQEQVTQYKDSYNTAYGLFFLFGLLGFLQWPFFITAHDYWMYKFRNISSEEIDSDHRTTLQTIFSPSLTAALDISTIVFLFLALFYGHKVSTRVKIYGPLFVILGAFVLTAVLVFINTDEWQIGFFIISLFSIGSVNAATTVMNMSLYSLVSYFPNEYIGALLTGAGVARIFSALLQVFTLAVGISTKGSALLYFWLGAAVVLITLIMKYAVSTYNSFYSTRYHAALKNVTEKRTVNMKETKQVLKKIWPAVVLFAFAILSEMSVHPAVTSLVVSEGEGEGEWNDTYFIPVVVYVIYALGDYFGRLIGVKLKIDINVLWFVAFAAIKFIVLNPLIVLCNAKPRHHLPVVFPHDYQFIIIVTVFSLTNGFIVSKAGMLIPELVSPEEKESALVVNNVAMGLILGILPLTSFASVEIL